MKPIVKTMTILALHGDVVQESVQRILDEKSARDPKVNPLGVAPQDPATNLVGNPHDKSGWPEAQCRGVIVAECPSDMDRSRVEIEVSDFEEVLGLKQGDSITITIERA